MNLASRGVRNAFRNLIRTGSIIVILGLSIGLSLVMLVAQKAVNTKIESVKSSVANTITVAPAGFNPGSSANNALTTSDLDKVKSLSNVTSVAETLTDRQSTTGSSTSDFGGRGGSSSSSSTTTSLTSPVTLGANGGGRFFAGGGGSSDSTTTFSLPISFLGTNDPSKVDATSITLKSGKTISGTADTNDVMISSAMATKNSLSVGSTFTAYNATLTVAGIFDTGSTSNQGADGTVVVSLPALQRLSGQSGVVTSAVVTVNSLDNLSSATAAVTKSLGSAADVTSAQEEADNTVKPLNSVKTVTTFSLIGATVAGAVIILLVMIMIVRERKREIGVVKAIGGSNLRIIGEFMVESITLAVLGAIVGLIIGVIGGQPVTNALVSNSTNSSSTTTQATPGNFGGGGGQRTFGGGGGAPSTGSTTPRSFGQRLGNTGAVRGLSNIKTQIGWSILAYGFGAALLIAIIGAGLAAGLIAKVRPSTVMRAD